MKISDFSSVRIKLASPDNILSWSHGEVTKPETINYRTQKPEKDGLFCERIFGPEKDYECYCGKYRRIRYKGIICDKCGVEVTRAAVRRERMGHIQLAVPVAHIWFLRGVPSRMGMFLDIPVQQLERVIYYASYIVQRVDEAKRAEALRQLEEEFKRKQKDTKDKEERDRLKQARDKELENLRMLKPRHVLSEIEYYNLSLKYGEVFSAGTGSEAVRKIMEDMDLAELRKELLEEIANSSGANQRKSQRRLGLVRRMREGNIRPEWMFLTHLPILPPDLRPMVQLDGGRYATSDLNDLYRRVINRNNRLKKLQEIRAPEIICRNEKRMLQEAVDALIDNSARRGGQTVTATTGGRRLLKSLADMLKGKQGRFRQNLLGKRVDYSGRSVIVVGPELELHQCGLPKKMALELFRPFVIQKIIERELAYNVRAAGRIIEEASPEVWALLEEVIEGKYVLLNRAPTLHRLSIQAFQPILIEGEAIRIHPLVCTAFNADFDGDQMAVHLPLSDAAQKEAGALMLSTKNLMKPATGSPIVNPTKDIVLGCFWMTKIKEGEKGEGMVFGTFQEARLSYEMGIIGLRARIRVRKESAANEEKQKSKFFDTCAGRILFNEALPRDFGFVNEEMNSRALRDITAKLVEQYDKAEAAQTLDRIKDLGFLHATLSGISWSMGDLEVPIEKKAILEKARKEVEQIKEQFAEGLLSVAERRNMVIEVWHRAKNEVTALVPKYLDPQGSVAMIISSGARGSWAQPNQMMGMKGLVINPAGQTMELPVESSFKEGFTALEYFISTHGARKGTADTALRTATAGYLTRRLVDVAQDVFITEKRCSDKEGFVLRRADAEGAGMGFEEKLIGRTAAQDIEVTQEGKKKEVIVNNGKVIDPVAGDRIVKDETIKEVLVFSPLTCKAVRGLCSRCYGWDLGHNKIVELGSTVGVVAAQAIGEPGTQLTMRTFHTGGVAGGGDITQGLPRVEEVFEARPPKGRAILADIEGVVEEIVEKENERIIRVRPTGGATPGKGKKRSAKTKQEMREYTIPLNVACWVAKGDMLAPGAQLSEGHKDLKELYDHVGAEETWRYIVNEVQKIYTSQGASIHDKHIEVIVRQMFSRVRIEDGGDSSLTPGDLVELAVAREENAQLRSRGKREARFEHMLLGITKVSLSTASFLSAASFQETSRVLIEAAISGNTDRLRGLKENVIVGKLIPAGTAFTPEEES